MMKAIQIRSFGGPEEMALGEWPLPAPRNQEILVKVAATALNRADLLQRQGKYPPPPGESPILGLEMAGTIVSIGSHVTDWKVGDRVCGLLSGGGYAEYAVLHEKMAMPVAENWSWEEAAAVPEVFLTAYQALRWLANIEEEERILIHAGGSGVGTAAIQLARELGASVLVTASAGKHDLCRELGAVHTIDYRTTDFKQAVLDYTGDHGVDVVVDVIGAPYFQRNLDVLRIDGRLVMLALMGGMQAENLNLGSVLRKRLHILGSTLRNRSLDYKIALTQELRLFAFPRFRKGSLRPIVDKVFSWKDVAEAHRYMEANRNQGKIVLRID